MKKPSIYPDRSQELLALFERAGNNKKVMYVPIDYAKRDHLVMFCYGYGEVLRNPFSVKNSIDGVKYLLDQVSRCCRHRHIRPEYVFFGGEDGLSRNRVETIIQFGKIFIALVSAPVFLCITANRS